LIDDEGSSNYSEIIIQFILPKDSGVVVSRAVVKELCIFFNKENHIDVLSNYGESKGFVKSVVAESVSEDLKDELRDSIAIINKVQGKLKSAGFNNYKKLDTIVTNISDFMKSIPNNL